MKNVLSNGIYHNLLFNFDPLQLLTCWTHVILAEPDLGWGLALGRGSFKSESVMSGKDYQGSSIYGVEVDYQWALGQSFSTYLLIFEQGEKGKISTKPNYGYYKLTSI